LRMDAPQIVELLTEADFDDYRSRGGIIVIHDDANVAGSKRVAHLQTDRKECSHVDAADFREKVLENAQRNGRYWWARNSAAAERALEASLCSESRRLLGRE
jgi:hypothetical protein